MTGWGRRGWLLLGLLGLSTGLPAALSVLAHRGQTRAVRAERAEQARRALRALGSRIRPLDPAVRKLKPTRELRRRVLGLFNGLEPETDVETNHLHLRLELILNHLGLLLEPRDVNDPLPADPEMSGYLGVVSWFNSEVMKDPPGYLRWLARQASAGRRVVILNGLGAARDLKGRVSSEAELNLALEAIGLRFGGDFTDNPHRIAVEHKDSRMVEFERPLPRRLEHYVRYQLLDRQGKSYLRLRRLDREQSGSDLVVVTSRGGFVATSYLFDEQKLAGQYVLSFRIDPFRFLAEALGVEQTPRPDFTTLGGARIYYSHIDGDGFPSISEVDRKTTCADFTRAQVLEPNDLPVTVSFVVAELYPPPLGHGNPTRLASARRIAALPNVELASHGLAHPMDWRAREKAICSYQLPGYRMSAEQEIVLSSRFLADQVAPPGKPVMAMLWTGWCNPSEDMLALAEQEGLYNLNGGDPVMDGQFPSYMHLAPPVHRVGKQRQYFTSGPNEYILTDEWKPPYHRWRNVLQTFERSETPVRLLPINVYYHFYVVEKSSGLAAMKDVMAWVLKQRPAPLWVSQYIDVVRDFEDLRLARLQEGSDEAWRVWNSGYCRTIRFDRWDRHLDLTRSRGVIGYDRLPGQRALYVHLDESHQHTIVLSSQPGRLPMVRRATSYLDQVRLGRDRVSFVTRGVGLKQLQLSNLGASSSYRWEASNQQGLQLRGQLRTDAEGNLSWEAAINGDRIAVTLVREAAGD